MIHTRVMHDDDVVVEYGICVGDGVILRVFFCDVRTENAYTYCYELAHHHGYVVRGKGGRFGG